MAIEVYGVIGLLALSFVVGYILAYLTRDEAGKAKRLYSLISGFSFLLTIIFPLFGIEKDMSSVVMLSLFFTGVVFFVMTLKALVNRKI